MRGGSCKKPVGEEKVESTWGQGPITYLREQTDKQRKNCEALLEEWTKARKVEGLDADGYGIHEAALTTASDSTKASYTAYRKEVLADFLKFRDRKP